MGGAQWPCGARGGTLVAMLVAFSVAPTWDEAMEVVKRAVEAVAARAPRVSLVLKADIRPGWTGQLQAKVERVERALGPVADEG